MSKIGEPWPEVLNAYLRAWEFRPTRAEPLHQIAHRYRTDGRYQLGYLFAERAASIPLPAEDLLFLAAEVYTWRALDEQAVCASWIGRMPETFQLCRRLLARDDIPEDDRKRIAANRDVGTPAMIDAAAIYPGDEVAHNLAIGAPGSDVTISLIAGPSRSATEATLNSLLNCCEDLSRVSRVLVLDAGMLSQDHRKILETYPFLDIRPCPPGADLPDIRELIDGRYWLHLGEGSRLFAPEKLIGRLTAVFEAEPQVVQVGINLDDATQLTGASAPESAVRRAEGAGRYVLADSAATGPAMVDTARLDRPVKDDARRFAALDEVLCVVGH
jgi:hypothetical protein